MTGLLCPIASILPKVAGTLSLTSQELRVIHLVTATLIVCVQLPDKTAKQRAVKHAVTLVENILNKYRFRHERVSQDATALLFCRAL
jgi:hypothetical protein